MLKFAELDLDGWQELVALDTNIVRLSDFGSIDGDRVLVNTAQASYIVNCWSEPSAVN